ncbi:hypothetical protein CIK76_04765 [Glutamicibacter sp. BW80]|uniref:hypothetical protein n=1 Tax=Glutamicibacter TaxID=1742989 RepID=UPI000BB6B2C1|nr:hypothetical protein [Glutamicibacter sp. BW80]PCC29708.1 hypothetical protein CIK76_04765 [Glutamicibacter sp. BW80]
MTNWTALIPAKIRTALYIGFGILSLAQTGILAYTSAVGSTAPAWAIGGGAVLGVIGGAFGFVAAGNTNMAKPLELDHSITLATEFPEPPALPDETLAQAHEAKRAYPVSEPHAPTEADLERYEK